MNINLKHTEMASMKHDVNRSRRECAGLRKVDYAIFSAMPDELEFFHTSFSQRKCETIKIQHFEFNIYEYNSKHILLAHTGLGTTFAASVVTLIYHHFTPDYILLSGTAGGIKSELNLGDVVIVEKAFEAEIQGAFQILTGTPFESCLTHPLNNQVFPPIYSADEELLQIAGTVACDGIKIHQGTVVSSNTFPAPKDLFDQIKSENTYSIDMETSAFYQVAWLLKARALAVRGISNVLNHDGTDDKIHESDIKGSSEAAAKVLLTILDALLLRHNNQLTLKVETNPADTNEVTELITKLKLQAHPEGGLYTRIFQSTDTVNSFDHHRYNNESRPAGTSIYYLLTGNDFSAWHSLQSDEIWHYYRGCPINIHIIDNSGSLTTHLLGDSIENPEACFQIAINAGNWFSAEPTETSSYCLAGCTVSPGFDFKDFKLADRTLLSSHFPQHSAIITRLTRAEKV